MAGRDLYDMRNALRRKGFVLCYSGSVNEAMLSGIGQALKQKMLADGARVGTARRVFGIFVEQMQNMIRYSAERESVLRDGARDLRCRVITIGQDQGGFVDIDDRFAFFTPRAEI